MPKIRYEFEGVDNGLSAMFQKFEDHQGKILKLSQENTTSMQQQMKLMNDYVNALDARKSLERNLQSQQSSGGGQTLNAPGLDKIASELRNVSSVMKDIGESVHMSGVDMQKSFRESVQNIIGGLQDAGGMSISGEVRHRLPSGVERFRAGESRSRVTYEERMSERAEIRNRIHGGGGRGGSRGGGGRSGFNDDGRPPNTGRGLGALAGAESDAGLIVGLMAAIPGVGIGLSMLANRFLKEAEQRETAYAPVHAITGGRSGSFQNFFAPFSDLTAFGFENQDFLNMYTQTSRGMGVAGSGQTARDLLIRQRALGLDQGTVMGQAGISRFTQGNDPVNNMDTMIRSAIASGMISKDDFSRVSELLEIQNSLITEQGRVVDSGVVANVMGAVSGAGGIFSTPAMGGVLSGINDTFKNPDNPMKQAFVFSLMRKMNPNASMWDTMMMQEQGIFNDSNPMLGQGLQSLLSMSGGDAGMAKFNLRGFLKGRVQNPTEVSERLMNEFIKNPGAFMNVNRQPGEGQIGSFLESLGLGATGIQMASKARISELMVDPGIELAKMGKNLEGVFEVVSDAATGALKGVNWIMEKIRDFMGDMENKGSVGNPFFVITLPGSKVDSAAAEFHNKNIRRGPNDFSIPRPGNNND